VVEITQIEKIIRSQHPLPPLSFDQFEHRFERFGPGFF